MVGDVLSWCSHHTLGFRLRITSMFAAAAQGCHLVSTTGTTSGPTITHHALLTMWLPLVAENTTGDSCSMQIIAMTKDESLGQYSILM